jgi:hypothetical protein
VGSRSGSARCRVTDFRKQNACDADAVTAAGASKVCP